MAEGNKNRNFFETTIATIRNIPTTDTLYNCAWANYELIIVVPMFYGNIMGATVVVPSSYINTTNSGRRVTVTGNDENTYELYKENNSQIYVVASATDANRGINVFGLSFGLE